jgi:hypothetical protein
VEHRDDLLSDGERADNQMLICGRDARKAGLFSMSKTRER